MFNFTKLFVLRNMNEEREEREKNFSDRFNGKRKCYDDC